MVHLVANAECSGERHKMMIMNLIRQYYTSGGNLSLTSAADQIIP